MINEATAYRSSSGLSSMRARESVFWASYPGRGGMRDFAAFITKKWCGRGDLNSHGLGPTDFKSVMSTIPSRPRLGIASGDSAGSAMMQKETILRNKK